MYSDDHEDNKKDFSLHTSATAEIFLGTVLSKNTLFCLLLQTRQFNTWITVALFVRNEE